MRNPQVQKLFIALILCTGYILGFSSLGTLAYDQLFNKNEQFGKGTFISSVDLSDLNSKTAYSLLLDKQKKWIKNTKITMDYKEKSVDLNLGLFLFQLKESMNIVESGKRSVLLVQLNENKLESFLQNLSPDLTNPNSINVNALKKELKGYAMTLEEGKFHIRLDEYLLQSKSNDVISEASIPYGGKQEELSNWVKQFSTVEIAPQSSFSLLKILGDKGGTKYSPDALSMIGTTIYKAIMSSNFSIAERHISRELPSYAEAGFEAKVNPSKNMDLVFSNSNDQKYFLNFKIINQLFYVSLEGPKFIYSYKISQNDKETFQPKTIIQFDATLPFNQEKITAEGKEGILLKIYREKLDENGAVLTKELLSEDFYPPINQIVVHSLLKNESTTTTINGQSTSQQAGSGTTTSPPVTSGNSESGVNSGQTQPDLSSNNNTEKSAIK